MVMVAGFQVAIGRDFAWRAPRPVAVAVTIPRGHRPRILQGRRICPVTRFYPNRRKGHFTRDFAGDLSSSHQQAPLDRSAPEMPDGSTGISCWQYRGGHNVVKQVTAALVMLMTSGAAVLVQSPQVTEEETRTLNLTAYAELLRSDVRTQKIAIITQMMAFTEAEDAAFWPIYREYDAEMAKLGDERVAMVEEYAKSYSQLTDATADKLAARALDLEARRQAAKAKCHERVKNALSPRTALRFLQVEHQLLLVIDLQIAAALPIVN
jgi:hypothetical protein